MDLEKVLFLVSYMINGALPWNHKSNAEIFDGDNRHKAKEIDIC